MSHPSNPSAEIAGNSSSSAGRKFIFGWKADQNAEIDHAAIQRRAFAAFLTFARDHAGKYFFKILKVEDKWTCYMREGEEAGNVVGQQAGNVAERWFKTLELRKWTVFDGISVTPGERVLFASEKQIVGSTIFVEFVTIPDRATLDQLVEQHLLSRETDKKRYDQTVEALAPSWDSTLDSSNDAVQLADTDLKKGYKFQTSMPATLIGWKFESFQWYEKPVDMYTSRASGMTWHKFYHTPEVARAIVNGISAGNLCEYRSVHCLEMTEWFKAFEGNLSGKKYSAKNQKYRDRKKNPKYTPPNLVGAKSHYIFVKK